VRLALNNPLLTAEQLARTITAEPLLPAKLLRVANSAALNPTGTQVSDIKAAVVRVGHSTIRSLAVNVALGQLTHMKDLEPFADEALKIISHSADVAAIAYVIARHMTKVNADEALFAGLVHDIGRFYLLSRIAKYPELQGEKSDVEHLVDEWHPAAGHAILISLGAPESVADAVNRHEDDDVRIPPKDVADVLNIANRVSHSPNPLNERSHNAGGAEEFVAPEVFDVLAENAEELRALALALKS